MNNEYLERGFDPSSLKVAQLRRVLTENNVEYVSHAKKAELVELFNEKVKPRIPKLRKKRENLLPSDKDIVKVRSKHKSKGKKKNKISKTKVKEEEGEENKAGDTSRRLKNSTVVDVKPEDELHKGDTSEPERGEGTPFSEINEFQQGSGRKSNSRKGKLNGQGSYGSDNEDVDMKLGSSEPMPTVDTPVKEESAAVSRKRKRMIGEGENTPITKKVAKKSSQKSPHRSLIIEKFESSSSDSSFNNSVILNVPDVMQDINSRGSTPENASGLDFSYRRKTLSPDLSKLNVSAAFAQQLKNAVKGNAENDVSQSESEHEFITKPGGVRVSRKSSCSAQNDHIVTPISGSTENHESDASSQGTIKSMDVEKHLSETPDACVLGDVIESAAIDTPLLPTEQDVQQSELRVEEIQHLIDEVADSAPFVQRKVKLKSFIHSLWEFLTKVMLFVFIITPILCGLWYRQQKLFVGYCGNEKTMPAFSQNGTILNKLDDYLQDFKPQCSNCPENAICYPYLEIKCRPEYTLQKNSWSLYGLIPLTNSCVKDSKRENLISEVVQKSLEFLRTKNAQFQCGECEDDLKTGMTEKELYDIFYEARAPWISDEEFDELWVQAISDLKEEPEITWRQLSTAKFTSIGNTNGTTEANGIQREKGHIPETNQQEETRIFRSTSKKYITIRCKFEREIYQTYYRFRYILWGLTSLFVFSKIIAYKLRKHYMEKEKIGKLTRKVILRLKEAKKDNSNTEGIQFLSTVQLRDVFLADVTDLNYKNVLWGKVVQRLEHNNTNIKSSLMEIHGEIMKCWEWIGPLSDNSEGHEHK